jgi:ABC-type lipoprotein export system ATPase subunit
LSKILKLSQIHLSYPDGESKIDVLRGLSLQVQYGEVIAITGPSGSGKSSLLSIFGTLLKPDEGEYLFEDKIVNQMDAMQLAELRNQSIGFIFQDHRLLPQFTVRENILLPTLAFQNQANMEQEQRATNLMKNTGIENLSHKYPDHLSGGECQRVAICRALIMKPKLLLADEPTGLLDLITAGKIVDLLLSVNADENCTLLMVTHSADVAKKAQKTYNLQNGVLT